MNEGMRVSRNKTFLFVFVCCDESLEAVRSRLRRSLHMTLFIPCLLHDRIMCLQICRSRGAS